jgi:hypothetical protein
MLNKPDKTIIGWREWVALSELGISRLKAKVDTGARTSTLHAFYVERFRSNGRDRVRFRVHPEQRSRAVEIECCVDLRDVRRVRDSGGHREKRMVIETPVTVGGQTWPIELTLTDRDIMKFRMLLGRTALRGRFVVDPARSFLQPNPHVDTHRTLLTLKPQN